MAFAKDYKEEITLAYYCFSLALTIAILIFGTIYLWYRDRRDQQRREWRQFAERIYSDYSKLKAKNIPRRISKVRDTFQNIRMNSTMKLTGLTVIRYMLANANDERSKTSQLECLGEDLQSIFQLFNVCSSLLLLGDIPKNIKEELTDVVSELGNIAEPFFKGKQHEIILKCLEHFGNSRPKPKTERTVRDLDARVEEVVPYVKSCLLIGCPYGNLPERPQPSDYSKCSKFSLNLEVINQGSNQVNLTFLKQLHADLEKPEYMADFARNLQEPPIPLIFEQLNDNDEDELVLVKVLHEVRFYIHLYLNENHLVEHREQIEANLIILRVVEKKVTRDRPTKAKLKGICDQFITDLQGLPASQYHCNSQMFCDQLEQLWNMFQDIQKG